MIDRWYYTHAGKTLGPVSSTQLRQLAASGQLVPNDLIWPDGAQQSGAVLAQAAVDFPTTPIAPAAPPPPLANRPDWLDDIRLAAKTERTPATPAWPDWLDHVHAAGEEKQEFLTMEWDGENADAEDEMAKQLLDESEESPEGEASPRPAAKAAPSCRLILGSATTRGRVR